MVVEQQYSQEIAKAMEGILLNDNNEALLLQRVDDDSYGGQWQPPTGLLEWGESPEEALQREFKEETGISIEPDQILNQQDYTIDNRHTILTAYAVEPQTDEYRVELSDEHQDYDWIAPDDAGDYDIIPPVYENLDLVWDTDYAKTI